MKENISNMQLGSKNNRDASDFQMAHENEWMQESKIRKLEMEWIVILLVHDFVCATQFNMLKKQIALTWERKKTKTNNRRNNMFFRWFNMQKLSNIAWKYLNVWENKLENRDELICKSKNKWWCRNNRMDNKNEKQTLAKNISNAVWKYPCKISKMRINELGTSL